MEDKEFLVVFKRDIDTPHNINNIVMTAPTKKDVYKMFTGKYNPYFYKILNIIEL